ncbi:MAG: cell division ATP-binding protein FtsE [Alphaproteobacteria bacterium]|nr:cell division ATP-binding protein FtsE [Pseudomonadota bacterium]TDI65858.1 MAG: cell division ATP-binding protein FtsE [Alphaproteobacteria bacterium]
MVRFQNVGMRYGLGSEVLQDINFELPLGSFHFLSGASGAGKSSLLKLIYLAHRPSHGLITLFGCDVTIAKRRELALIRRRIGVVFQDFRLLGHLSVIENVALPLKIKGENWDRISAYAAELLAWVGLQDCIDASPLTLSGGQQQRVAIARAVISKPEILLADEPTGNVDDAIALRLLYLFEELNRHGTTVLIATHNENLMDRFDHPRLHLAGGELSGPFGGSSRPAETL